MRGDDPNTATSSATCRRSSGCRPTSVARDSTDDRRGAGDLRRGYALYSRQGRPSVPPEQLLRALLLQVLYSIRSERMLIEQFEYNLLFRWFVGLAMDAELWVPTTFTKNRTRLLEGEIAQAFFDAVTRGGRCGRSALGRALHRGRLVAAGLGQSQELSPKDTPDPADAIRGIPRWISRGAAQRHASVDDRSGRAVGSQGRRDVAPGLQRDALMETATAWWSALRRRRRRAPPKGRRRC